METNFKVVQAIGPSSIRKVDATFVKRSDAVNVITEPAAEVFMSYINK